MLYGIAFYAVVCWLLRRTYDYSNMGLVNAVWSALSVLSIVAVGTFMFHESLNMNDIIGFILVCISIGLIFVKGHGLVE